jgi:hypothetical protein
MTKRAILISCALACAAATACDKAPTPPGSTGAPASPSAPSGAREREGVVDAPAVAESATYRLAIAPIDGADESEQAFEVSLAGVGDWHVTTEYPISVTVAADQGLELPKSKLDRDEAAELSDDVARFVFVARSSGPTREGRVSAHVKFAMCIPTSCTFHDETVGVRLGPK